MDQKEFDALYLASKPPEIRALFEMPPFSEQRKDAAVELAKQGFVIDALIDGQGFDAYWLMLQRAVDGYAWVASALQPQSLGPGIDFPTPGFVPYVPTPPPGSIVVIDPRTAVAADLKPFDPPAPPPPLPEVGLIGPQYAPGEYTAGPAAWKADHTPAVENGKEYQGKTAHVKYIVIGAWLIVFTDPGTVAPF